MKPKKNPKPNQGRLQPRAEVSYRMSRIRSKDTGIEVALRQALTQKGLRYRKNYRAISGSPDVVFVARKVAVFCDSSFWHGRDWRQLRKRLRSNRQFWINKIKGNMARDRRINRELSRAGWTVLRFWEEEIREQQRLCVAKVIKALRKRELEAR